MCRKTAPLSLAVVIALGLACAAFAGEAGTSKADDREFSDEARRITAVNATLKPGSDNDLARYEKFAEEVDAKWRGRDRKHYGRLMLSIFWPLASGSFSDKRQHDLALKYALSILETPNDIDLDVEVPLVEFLALPVTGDQESRGPDWTATRLKYLRLRLHAWQRLLDAVDPAWDASDLQTVRRELEADATDSVARSREIATDHAARKKHNQEMQALQERFARSEKQWRVREALQSFSITMPGRIAEEYSTWPYDFSQLETELSAFKGLDAAQRAQILDKARERSKVKWH